MQYILDTNICIHFLRGQYGIPEKVLSLQSGCIAISEITRLELLYGIEKALSKGLPLNHEKMLRFLDTIRTIPLTNAIPLVAREKARLETDGTPIDDYDLIIGCTAVAEGAVLVTENTRHMGRIGNIMLENWTLR